MNGALIDPKGRNPQSLTEEEHTRLKNILDLMRMEPGPPIALAIGWLIYVLQADATAEDVLDKHIWQYIQDSEKDHGVLWSPFNNADDRSKETKESLSQEEFEFLRDSLTTLRIGGWFAEWLSLQVSAISGATRAGDRSPTPLEMMGRITLDVEEFDTTMELAHDMVKLRPDLFQSAIAPPAKESEPPQATTPKKRAHRKRAA